MVSLQSESVFSMNCIIAVVSSVEHVYLLFCDIINCVECGERFPENLYIERKTDVVMMILSILQNIFATF